MVLKRITPELQARAVNFGARNVPPTLAGLGFRWPADKSRVSYDWVGYDPESDRLTALREYPGEMIPAIMSSDEVERKLESEQGMLARENDG